MPVNRQVLGWQRERLVIKVPGDPTTRTGIDSVPKDIIDEEIRAAYTVFGEALGKRIAEDALRERLV